MRSVSRLSRIAKVERVVLNALANGADCAACYQRLRRFVCHRLEDKTIHPVLLKLPPAKGIR
jgi:hypothetical protein